MVPPQLEAGLTFHLVRALDEIPVSLIAKPRHGSVMRNEVLTRKLLPRVAAWMPLFAFFSCSFLSLTEMSGGP